MSNPALDKIATRFAASVEERSRNRAMKAQTQAITEGAFTLERLICDPQMGAFKQASPVQVALMRAADGRPVELPPAQMKFHFGVETLPNIRPFMVILETGVRAGKTMLSAGGLLRSVLTCRFRRPPEGDEIPDADGLIGVRRGEVVRAPIVGPTLDHCRQAFAGITALLNNSAVLSRMIVKQLQNSVTIRRPDGFEVIIEKVATAAGGAKLRSTWLAGILFDEADFHGAADASDNLDAQIQAIRTRMLPEAQIWIASSPWSDSSPFHTMHSEAFGKPSKNALAFHSDSRSMNPSLSRELEEAERTKDPVNAAREWDAIPLPSGSTRFFPDDAIAKSVNPNRPSHLAPLSSARHYCGADWGFEKNSSTIAISRNELVDDRVKTRLAFFHELQPTREESLRPAMVVNTFATSAMDYGCRTIRSDHYLEGMLRNEFNDFRAKFHDSFDKSRVPAQEGWTPDRDAQTTLFTELRRRMQEGTIEIPNDPRLLTQFRGVTSKPVPGGTVKIVLPTEGTTHGDLIMAVALSLVAVPEVRPAPPRVQPTRRAPTRTYGDFCADDIGHDDGHNAFFERA